MYRPTSLAFLALAACLPELPDKVGEDTSDTENEPPTAPVVSIGPTSARTDDDLRAVIDVPAVDPDGDAIVYVYTWKQQGLPRTDLTTDTVPAIHTARGELWEVSVSATDGEASSAPASAATVVANTLPVVTVSFTNAAPTTSDDLVASATVVDADGDEVTLSYAWTVDGVESATRTDTVSAAATSRGEVWQVVVTPDDGTDTGEPARAEVRVDNDLPEVLSVTLAPSPDPRATDAIIATVESYDADGDSVGYRYRWFVDGTEAYVGGSDTLPAGSFTRGQRVSVEVTPTDGYAFGAAFVSADVTIANSAPEARAATIDPAEAREGSVLTCQGVGFTDADDDPEAWNYGWAVNGTEVYAGPTLDGTWFSRGDTVTCTAAPYDGWEEGATVRSDAVVVVNSAPTLTGVTLSGYAPIEGETLTATPLGATDADGDAVSVSYAWYVNGSVVSSSATLGSELFARGDRIHVAVTPTDGREYGTPVTSAVATVGNSMPVVSGVTLSPSGARTDDTITATASVNDPDGDTVTLQTTWTVNGVAIAATGTTLDGTRYFERGDRVVASVVATDGSATSAAYTSSTLTVQDSPPSAPVVSITPDPAEEGDSLSCSVVTASTDADGDSVTYSFAWTVDGVAYTGATSSATSSTVPGSAVMSRDAWTCTATATAAGVSGSSAEASLEVESSMPVLGSATTVSAGGCAEPPNWGDINGDGRADFACITTSDTVVAYTRGGTASTPTWTSAWSVPWLGFCASSACGDRETVTFGRLRSTGNDSVFLSWGDGRGGGYSGNLTVYANTGTALPTASTWSARGASLSSWSEFAGTWDLDQNGTMELVNTNLQPYPGYPTYGVRIFSIGGTGAPTGTVWTRTPSSLVADAADVDDDGDLDLLVCGFQFPHTYYEKDNAAAWNARVYEQTSALAFSEAWATPTRSTDAGDADCAFADIDGDGDEDVVVSSVTSTAQGVRGFENIGGTFDSSVTWSWPYVSERIRVADWDGDGRDEVLLADDTTSSVASVVDLENGIELARLPSCAGARWIDWNEDGVPDLSCQGTSTGTFQLVESR